MPISLIATPFPLSAVRLGDSLFRTAQVRHASYLLSIDADRLLVPFREQAGLPAKATRYGGWEEKAINGHSLGHYLSALSHLWAATSDSRVRERIDHIVAELAACQEAHGDGCLLPVPRRIYDEVAAGDIRASAFDLNGCWVPNYTLHKLFAGLRDAWRQAVSERSLMIERRLADWLIGKLSPLSDAQLQQMLTCEHGGMNEVLADLTADTGDARYLRFAERAFHHASVLAPLLRGEDKLDGLHGNTQIPKLVGLASEYELTNDPRYRLAVESFWDNVVNRRSYAIGGHGECEHFFPVSQFPQKLTPYTAESCNSYNLIKLTGHLFSWQPRAEHMDFVERALLNHLLANLGQAPGEIGYFLGLGGVGYKVFSTPTNSWWCCVGTGMETPTRFGEQIYCHGDDALWVNLYLASMLTWTDKAVTLVQSGSFPDGDTVRFVVACKLPTHFALHLRHPYWCAAPEVTLNGEPVAVTSTPVSYLTLARVWQNGDVLGLRLPMTLRAEPLPHSDGRRVALMFGPTVLAAVVPTEPGAPDPAKERVDDHLKARGKTDQFPPVLVATSVADALTKLRPTGRAFAEFSSAGLMRPGDLTFVPLYRIYEEHYAVYFPLMNEAEWQARKADLEAEQQREAALAAATVDTVEPGLQQPEVEHHLAGEQMLTNEFQARKYREAHNGGWFAYDMAVDPALPMTLAATWWGGEWRARRFDILIDGQAIATQRLWTNRPGNFFAVEYPIPPTLTAGKQRVTVRFQAHPGDIAGRLFHLRMVRTPHYLGSQPSR